MMNSRWAVDANCGGTATLLSIGNPEQDNLIREDRTSAVDGHTKRS
jgi:hypothetical protein